MNLNERRRERYKNDPALRDRMRKYHKAYWQDRKGTEQYAKKLKRLKEYAQQPHVKEKIKGYIAKYRTKARIFGLIRSALNRCKKSGMECDKDYLLSLRPLRPEFCPCCKRPLDYAAGGTSSRTPRHDAPSLDRIDTTKGYVRGNVDIICWRCNALKRDGTLSELRAILDYMERKLNAHG